MNKYFLILIAIILLFTTAAAQVSKTDGEYLITPQRQFDNGHCKEYEVKMLYMATNFNDPQQSQYLLAADAYNKLDLEQQVC